MITEGNFDDNNKFELLGPGRQNEPVMGRDFSAAYLESNAQELFSFTLSDPRHYPSIRAARSRRENFSLPVKVP
jgi:hypothetical protein